MKKAADMENGMRRSTMCRGGREEGDGGEK
jgi:hypothetical protein